MVNFISNLISNPYLATIIMSFVPLVELKGAIMFSRGIGLSFFEALSLSFLGSTAIAILLFFLLIPILCLLKKIKWFNGFVVKVENYIAKKADETVEKQKQNPNKKVLSETRLKQIAIFIFVAIPLPMTGVWMGTAIAVFLGLKFKESILPLALGNLFAGLIISLIAEICLVFWTLKVLDYILYGMFALALILLVLFIIKVVKSKGKEEK